MRVVSNNSPTGNNNLTMKVGVVLPFQFSAHGGGRWQGMLMSWLVCSWKVSNNIESVVCNTSNTNYTFKSEGRVSFLTYHGTPVIMRIILTCMTCMFCMFV